MGLIDRFKNRGIKQAPLLTREQAMQALPVRNPSLTWSENETGEAVIVLPRRKDATGKFLGWAFFVPEAKPIALDEVGTFVWKLCDGEHSVVDIVTAMCKEYKLGRREVELSLNEYIKMLSKRGMLGVAVPNYVLEQLDDRTRKTLGIELAKGTEAAAPETEHNNDPQAEA